MIKSIIKKIVHFRNTLIYKQWNFLARINKSKFRVDSNAEFIVSIASYPKRAHLLPSVFEALNKQRVVPQKWILVLSEEEWVDLSLPDYLNKLVDRGIEIIWVKENSYAVKKLVPVIEKYPSLAIVTLDDDIIYHHSLLEGLVQHNSKDKDTIVGYVGKALLKKGNVLHMFYREKNAANISTPQEQVYLIGWGGIYYPSNSLHEKVLNMDAIHQIVPGRGSDIWFWAAAISKNTKQICLGMPTTYNLGIPIPQNIDTQPKDIPKTDVLLNRFQSAIDYFGIREKLIAILPNQE